MLPGRRRAPSLLSLNTIPNHAPMSLGWSAPAACTPLLHPFLLLSVMPCTYSAFVQVVSLLSGATDPVGATEAATAASSLARDHPANREAVAAEGGIAPLIDTLRRSQREMDRARRASGEATANGPAAAANESFRTGAINAVNSPERRRRASVEVLPTVGMLPTPSAAAPAVQRASARRVTLWKLQMQTAAALR